MIRFSTFGADWLRIEGGVSAQRNTIFFLSLRYGGDRKRRKNSDGTSLTQISAPLCYTPYASPYSCHVSRRSVQNERVIPEHRNVCYVYYNKIRNLSFNWRLLYKGGNIWVIRDSSSWPCHAHITANVDITIGNRTLQTSHMTSSWAANMMHWPRLTATWLKKFDTGTHNDTPHHMNRWDPQ